MSLNAPAAGNVAGTIPVAATADDNASVARVEFRVGGVLKFTDPSAPFGGDFNTTSMADGTTTITATAFDTAGNATSASKTIKIDNTKPSLAVTGPDLEKFAPGTTQTWAIAAGDDGSGLTSVHCSLVVLGSAASFGPCSGGTAAHTVTNNPEGLYTFTVRATDAVGNVAATSRNFRIDATAPDTTIASGIEDGGTTPDTSLTWELVADEPAAFECRVYPAALTPGAFAPCSDAAGHTASGFAPGAYTFEARATDGVGNVDATPAKRTFTVVTLPPVAPATPAPASASGASVVNAPAVAVARQHRPRAADRRHARLQLRLDPQGDQGQPPRRQKPAQAARR